jgi:hypothetical protein
VAAGYVRREVVEEVTAGRKQPKMMVTVDDRKTWFNNFFDSVVPIYIGFRTGRVCRYLTLHDYFNLTVLI